MSLNRENVTWQTQQGTWSIGFFAFSHPDSEEYDHEWEVEYDHGSFWWVSTGHADPDAAMNEYRKQEANPGGSTWVHWSEENAAEIARYEEMAATRRAEEARLMAGADLRPIWERYPYGTSVEPVRRTVRAPRIRARTNLK